MRGWVRRTPAVVVGIALGWLAGGVGPSVITGADASPEEHQAGPDHTTAVAADHGHGHAAAGHLAVEVTQVPWYGPVLVGGAGLFVAAVVLGWPSAKLRDQGREADQDGPEPSSH